MTASDSPVLLRDLLRQTFGFAEFRPGQEQACRAIVEGRDALVVMPTGSGKSLCYQLPALLLGGTALIVSPLIALMEDQVAKLNANGLRAERIHSGRTRDASRAAALAYRDGELQFLFIAPERFSVPGFPEFLAKRKPCLIAVDEAHCISQWGHDFRPDYRMLQRYFPLLRPSPIIALTATATPVVQNDIVSQLALQDPLRSIQGFRRKNIAIEIVEVAVHARAEAVLEVLREADRRPAIVYVPTRAESDSLANDLGGHFRAEPYHAGLPSARRQSVQERFLAGEVDVAVATIAFGMGIDKPDVRTVIHTALPGSTEAYYQEIGRAGRDGAPSRAILMHAYADRRRHDFFFNRDYPEAEVLEKIFDLLGERPASKEAIYRAARLEEEVFDTALDKLWVHGGALIDPEENVARGTERWRQLYRSQSEHRMVQLELMLRYAAFDGCRMAALVRYFGDRSDTQAWCGMCDFCAAEKCVVQHFREANATEQRVARRILVELANGLGRSTGKLHAEAGGGQLDRDEFEELLAALGRAGLVALQAAVFEKDGKQIPYRTVRLTADGEALEENDPLHLQLREKQPKSATRQRKRKMTATSAAKSGRPQAAANEPLMQALREWRLQEARSKSLPAFRIASDAMLRNIVEDLPASEEDLLAVAGIGPAFAKRYGAEVLTIVENGG